MNETVEISVIGAGLGGLSAAIRLSSAGYKVNVYEKNSFPGGKAGSLSSEGFRFDTGPTLLTMPFVLEDLFESAGVKIENYLSIIRPEINCRYYYHDGTVLNAYSDTDRLALEIENKTSDSRDSLNRYLNYCGKIYDLAGELFLFKSPTRIWTYFNLKAFGTLLRLNQIDPFRTMDAAVRSFFKDEKLIELFDRYATYNGSNPFEAPATLNIIPHVELSLGGYIAEGGMHSVTESLYRIAREKGVKFYFNSEVSEILICDDKVSGIKTEKKIFKSDAVISNADVAWTYSNLISDNSVINMQDKRKKTPSMSGIVFYWGIKGIHEELDLHNILFSYNYKKEFEQIFSEHICPDDPTVYIHISSKINKQDAPDGCENWFVMVNAPYVNGQNWEKEIRRVRIKVKEKIKNRLNIDLNGKIITENIMSPVDIERTTYSTSGSIYGYSSNSRYSAFFRHPNYSSKIKGLYFCGGSVHPGGGVPLVLLSGKIASELLKADIKRY